MISFEKHIPVEAQSLSTELIHLSLMFSRRHGCLTRTHSDVSPALVGI